MRSATSSSRRGVELDARLLRLAQHPHERQLDVAQEALEAALADLLALAAGQLVREHRARGLRVLRLDRHPALLAQLVERVAAAGGVEQVGGDLRVEGEVAPAPRRAPWRRGRSPGGRPPPATSRAGSSTSPASAYGPPA